MGSAAPTEHTPLLLGRRSRHRLVPPRLTRLSPPQRSPPPAGTATQPGRDCDTAWRCKLIELLDTNKPRDGQVSLQELKRFHARWKANDDLLKYLQERRERKRAREASIVPLPLTLVHTLASPRRYVSSLIACEHDSVRARWKSENESNFAQNTKPEED